MKRLLIIPVAILVLFFTSSCRSTVDLKPQVNVPEIPKELNDGYELIITDPQTVYDLATNSAIYAALLEKYVAWSDELYDYIVAMSLIQ